MFLHCHLPSHSDSWERELWWHRGAEASAAMSQQDRALLSCVPRNKELGTAAELYQLGEYEDVSVPWLDHRLSW